MEQRRLHHIQNLAYDIMEKMNTEKKDQDMEHMQKIIDYLSRAIGSLTDPTGKFSIDYVEEKVASAHYLLFQNEKKLFRKTFNKQSV